MGADTKTMAQRTVTGAVTGGAVATNTHHRINQDLCGTPREVVTGRRAIVELAVTPEMTADDSGLTHGGFYFGLADYAAMLAINHPNVVLGSADVKFLKPVTQGDRLVATATVVEGKGKKTHRGGVSDGQLNSVCGGSICSGSVCWEVCVLCATEACFKQAINSSHHC